MDEKLDVLVNFFKPHDISYSSRIIKYNTDFRYPENFKLLECSEINIIFNNSNRSFLHYLSLYSLQKLAEKLQVDLNRFNSIIQQQKSVYIPQKLLTNKTIFFSHCLFPVGLRKRGTPVLTNTGFMTNQYEGIFHDEERWKEVRQICKMSDQSTYITFSTENAIERFCSFAPKMRHKIKLAPFLIPKIEPLSEEEMYNKHFSNTLKICFVGIDGTRKGLFNLLAAIRNIYRQDQSIFTNCEFNFVTRDAVMLPQGVNYKHFKYLPNADVLNLMRDCAIFCMPTLKDAYGLVYLEAMGSGCSVLCDDELPRKEIFNHNLAYFTNPNSISEIERGLAKLILDKVYRYEMSIKAYRRFQHNYSFETTSRYYKDLFKETVLTENFYKVKSHKPQIYP